MAVGAVQGLYMQSEPSVCGQRLKEFAHQLGVERADFLGRERDVEDEEGSTGQIERDAGQRTTPRLSPSAAASACPTAIPTSSTVWC
jgi:hypothetical protein